MDGPPPPGLDDRHLADALARTWGLEVGRLDYVPMGFGGYHWRWQTTGPAFFLTVDDLATKPWLGETSDAAFAGLEAAYDSALALRERANLDFVVAPVARPGGGTALRLSERYALTVFPFVDGASGVWGRPVGRAERARLLRRLADLHRSTPVVAPRAPRHGVALAGRAGLVAALHDVGRPWGGGPFSEPARRELAGQAAAVRAWLADFDRLAGLVAETGGEHVVTHGEPHPGNLLRTDDGVLLVDWDTVGLAPPERDLWMFDDGSPNALAPYAEASGRSVDDRALALYRLAWRLADVAVFTSLFRSEHERNRDTEKSWRAYTDLLEGSFELPTVRTSTGDRTLRRHRGLTAHPPPGARTQRRAGLAPRG